MLSAQSLQFLFLAHQEILPSLNTLHQLLLELLLSHRQILDIEGHLIVVDLQTVPLVLGHPFAQHLVLSEH